MSSNDRPEQETERGEDTTSPADTVETEAPEDIFGDEGTGPDGEGVVEESVEDLVERITALEEENSDLKDKYLRKQADFENFRKRMARERQEAVRFSNQQLLLDLTTVIDDFERAIRSAQESQDFAAFHDGVVIIEQQLTGMLARKWGLQRFETVGEEFDPQKHEAVTTEPVADFDTTRVVEEYQRGYMLHERVLRSAKVKVTSPAVSAADNPDQEESAEE